MLLFFFTLHLITPIDALAAIFNRALKSFDISNMTKIILVPIILFPFISFGQTNFDTTEIRLKYSQFGQLYYFLDSERIDIDKTYFNYKEIKNVSIVKDTVVMYATTPICRINLSTNIKNRKLAGLSDIHLNNSNDTTVRLKTFIIDDKIISDTSNVRIDPTFVKSISIVNEGKGLNSNRPESFIYIKTKRKVK